MKVGRKVGNWSEVGLADLKGAFWELGSEVGRCHALVRDAWKY